MSVNKSQHNRTFGIWGRVYYFNFYKYDTAVVRIAAQFWSFLYVVAPILLKNSALSISGGLIQKIKEI